MFLGKIERIGECIVQFVNYMISGVSVISLAPPGMILAALCSASALTGGEVGCSPVGFHKNLFEWRRSQEEERMETLMGHSGPDHRGLEQIYMYQLDVI